MNCVPMTLMSFDSSPLNIPMPDCDLTVLTLKTIGQFIHYHHRSVPSTRTPDADRQIGSSLLLIKWNRKIQEISQMLEKRPDGWIVQHVGSHVGIFSG